MISAFIHVQYMAWKAKSMSVKPTSEQNATKISAWFNKKIKGQHESTAQHTIDVC